MRAKARLVASILAPLLLAGTAPTGAFAGDAPAGVAALEREVSLKIAHVRDEGPTDPAKRTMLSEAERLDQKAEQEIAKADYHSARHDLLSANKILDGLVK